MIDDLPLDRLTPWLQANLAGFESPVSVSVFGVGQSNPTYCLTTPQRRFVLRRKPPGVLLESAHAVDREFRVQKALFPIGFPVPRPHVLCMDPGVIGSIFYVMDMVDGAIEKDGGLANYTPTQRRAAYYALTDTLADLHGYDHVAIGLGDFGRPANFYIRQLDRWTRQFRAATSEPSETMETLIAQLAVGLPHDIRTTLVHGDFRLDNVVMAPNMHTVRAVLDWELSTLGDPLGDLAYFLLAWVMPAALSPNNAGMGDRDLKALGIPSMDDTVNRYQDKTGCQMTDGLHWRLAFNLFRLAAIYQGIAARAEGGNAISRDAHSFAARVEPMARLALAQLAMS